MATRGNTSLDPEDVAWAVERGVNYLNWCLHPDGLSRYVRESGANRDGLIAAAQFKARLADGAEREMDWILEQLGGRLDVATLYYVESQEEWDEIISPGGAWEVLAERRRRGELARIGLTTHQRPLGALWAEEKSETGEPRLDLLMARYNAAHRGAEQDIFPVTTRLGKPVVSFTGLRWRKLLATTPEDPLGFEPPDAAECYRFCLSNPSVSVALTAPNGRRELEQNLRLLEDWRAAEDAELAAMRAHGDRVRRNSSEFW